MKSFTVLCGTICFIFVCLGSSFAASRYVEIKKAYVPVYEYLDPQSKILIQAQKKDIFELIYEGTSWYQVKVKNNVGWIEKSAGNIVSTRGFTIFTIPIGTFIFFLLLLIATITGASFLIYKQKTAEL